MDMTEDINQLVVDIWSSVLQMSAAPVPPVSRPDEVRLTGFVHISGDWEGTVTVDCPLPLAASATAMMFGMEVDEVSKADIDDARSEEHTSELQSLMRTSYAVFCLKKK